MASDKLPYINLEPYRDLYPFQSRYKVLDSGFKMHYVDEGQGRPVVFVHGNPSWSFLFRNIISGLKGNFRCLAPDNMGMGLSSRPGENEYGFRLADRIDDLTQFMAQLNLTEPVHLVMHDWGGPIGLGWALNHMAQVASVTIMNSGTGRPEENGKPYQMPWRLAMFQRLGDYGVKLAASNPLFVKGTAGFAIKRPVSPRIKEAYAAPYYHREYRLAIGKFVGDIPLEWGHPTYNLLKEIDQRLDEFHAKPCQIIWGQKDFVFTDIFLRNWQKRWPEAANLILPTAGHYLTEDEPGLIVDQLKFFFK